jgi:hypothetical protein
MNKSIMCVVAALFLVGCWGDSRELVRWEDDARAECMNKKVNETCRAAVCGEDFNGYYPRGVCVDSTMGKMCLPYGPKPPQRIYCGEGETCQLYKPTNQAVCK